MSRKRAADVVTEPLLHGRTAAALVNDIPGVITDPPVDDPATVAGLEGKLSAARLEAERERQEKEAIAERLSRFGDRAGKHGPRAEWENRIPIMLRIPSESDDALVKIGRYLGVSKATVLRQMACTAAKVPPERWYETLAAMPRR